MACVDVIKLDSKDGGIWYSTAVFVSLDQASKVIEQKLFEYCVSECVTDIGFSTPSGYWKFHLDSMDSHPDQMIYMAHRVLAENIGKMFPDLGKREKKGIIGQIKFLIDKIPLKDSPPIPRVCVKNVVKGDSVEEILQSAEDLIQRHNVDE